MEAGVGNLESDNYLHNRSTMRHAITYQRLQDLNNVCPGSPQLINMDLLSLPGSC